MKPSSGDRIERYHRFLRRLRAGGRSNMYGAVPYLMRHFGLERDTAFRVVCDWIDAQDAAELAGAVTGESTPRLRQRTPAARAPASKRSRTRG